MTPPTAPSRMNPWRVLGWSFAMLLLLTPAVAMRFTDQVHWTLGDFVFAAVLLGTTGSAFELAARHSHDRAYRAGAGLTLLAVFLLVWINGAVGIIGSEREPANRLYAVVLLIALGGALLARFRPAGLARTLFVTALTQALVAVVALAMGWGRSGPIHPFDLLGLTAGFGVLFTGAGLLFRIAARRNPSARTA